MSDKLAGHPPAVKAGGMRVGQAPHPPKHKAEEEVDGAPIDIAPGAEGEIAKQQNGLAKQHEEAVKHQKHARQHDQTPTHNKPHDKKPDVHKSHNIQQPRKEI